MSENPQHSIEHGKTKSRNPDAVLLPYVLTGEAAESLGVENGTKIMYELDDEETVKAALGEKYDTNKIYMGNIYDEHGKEFLGRILTVDPRRKNTQDQ